MTRQEIHKRFMEAFPEAWGGAVVPIRALLTKLKGRVPV